MDYLDAFNVIWSFVFFCTLVRVAFLLAGIVKFSRTVTGLWERLLTSRRFCGSLMVCECNYIDVLLTEAFVVFKHLFKLETCTGVHRPTMYT